jgi:hypothetical protein
VVDDVAADFAAEARALLIGVVEVEAGQDSRLVDLLDCVVEAVYSRVVPVVRLSSVKATLSVRRTPRGVGCQNSVRTREVADLQVEGKSRHPARDPVFKLSGRSTSEFFGVIRVGRQL